MGGKWFKSLFGENPTEKMLYDIAVKEVKEVLKIDASPIRSHVTIGRQSIPQHTVGHYSRVANMREFIQYNSIPLSLLGNSYDGVGINDCIYHSQNTVQQIIKNLSK